MCAAASAARNRHAVRPMTMPSAAPTSNAPPSAATSTAAPLVRSVLRGFRYSTGACGGALYGAALTASPSDASARGSFSSVP